MNRAKPNKLTVEDYVSGLTAFTLFERSCAKVIQEMTLLGLDRLSDLLPSVPQKSLGIYLIFFKAAFDRGIQTIDQLKALSQDEKMLLAADFFDAKANFEAEQKRAMVGGH